MQTSKSKLNQRFPIPFCLGESVCRWEYLEHQPHTVPRVWCPPCVGVQLGHRHPHDGVVPASQGSCSLHSDDVISEAAHRHLDTTEGFIKTVLAVSISGVCYQDGWELWSCVQSHTGLSHPAAAAGDKQEIFLVTPGNTRGGGHCTGDDVDQQASLLTRLGQESWSWVPLFIHLQASNQPWHRWRCYFQILKEKFISFPSGRIIL